MFILEHLLVGKSILPKNKAITQENEYNFINEIKNRAQEVADIEGVSNKYDAVQEYIDNNDLFFSMEVINTEQAIKNNKLK